MSQRVLTPGEALRFNEEQESNLATLVWDLVSDLDIQHSKMISDIDVHWEWYEAKPLAEQRTEPWANASNVVVPLTRIASDAIIARYTNAIFATNKLLVGRTQNEGFKEFVGPIVDFLNWAGAGNDFDMLLPTIDWITELVPIGSSVAAVNWRSRDRWLFLPGEGGKPKPVQVNLGRGPTFEHVPRSQILWQPGRALDDSDIVVRQAFMTRREMAQQVQLAGWSEEAVDESEPATGGPGLEAYLRKLEMQGIQGAGAERHMPRDVREVWVEVPFLRGNGLMLDVEDQNTNAPSIPIVVTIDMTTRRVLRAVAKPYPIPGWPFFDIYLRRRPGQMGSPGLAKIMDHPQRAATTMVNQAIDAITLANSIVGKTQDSKVVSQQFSPNKWLLVDDISETQEFNLSKIVVPDISLINMMVAFGERLSGVADPTLGRETRLGGHPQPATSFVAGLQEANKLFSSGLRSIRKQIGRAAEVMATLYQFYGSTRVDDHRRKIERALGPRDADKVSTWMFPQDQPIIGNMQFDLHAVSETMNPEVEAQRAVLISQMTGNYFAQILQAISVLEQGQITSEPGKQAVIQSIEALGESHRQFLEASQVDEIETYLFKLKENNDAGQQGQVIGQLQSRVAELAGDVPGLAERGALGTVPAGPNGTSGPVPGAGGSGF